MGYNGDVSNSWWGRIQHTMLGIACVVAATGCGSATDETAGKLSPVENLVGVSFDNLDEHRDEVFRVANEHTRRCMTGRGFEYEVTRTTRHDYPDDAGPGTSLWKDRYGFGASTTRFPQPLLPEPLVGTPVSIPDGPGAHDLYLRSLTDGERAAYDAALMGSGEQAIPGSSSAEIEQYLDSSDGCSMIGHRKAVEDLPYQRLFDHFGDEVFDLFARADSDPKMIIYEQDLRSCMTGQGFAWTTYPQVLSELNERANAFSLSASGAEGRGFWLDPNLFESLGELQQHELELAEAFRECEVTLGSRAELHREVRLAYEVDFVNDNRSALAEIGLS